MPNALVKSFARKTGRSIPEIEKLFKKAKAIAFSSGDTTRKDVKGKATKGSDNNRKATNGNDNNRKFALTVGILKKMLKLKESSDIAKGISHKMKIKLDSAGIDICFEGSNYAATNVQLNSLLQVLVDSTPLRRRFMLQLEGQGIVDVNVPMVKRRLVRNILFLF